MVETVAQMVVRRGCRCGGARSGDKSPAAWCFRVASLQHRRHEDGVARQRPSATVH
jgi:hypothetical protein